MWASACVIAYSAPAALTDVSKERSDGQRFTEHGLVAMHILQKSCMTVSGVHGAWKRALRTADVVREHESSQSDRRF